MKKLPPIKPPKVKAKQQTLPSYMKTAKPSGELITPTDQLIANKSLTDYRNDTTTRGMLLNLSKSSPDLSSAISAALRMAITSEYTLVARNLDGTIDPEATNLMFQLAAQFDVLNSYGQGFGGAKSLRSNSESLGREIMLYGSCSAELVLDKTRLPQKIAPISVTQIKFKDEADGLVPYQLIAGEEISLDIPTFFYTSLDQDLLIPYSDSPIAPAIQPILAVQAFTDDLRRIFKRAIHPRIQITIDEEKWRKNLPPEIAYDASKIATHMNDTITAIADQVNGLSPEDAMIYFDSLEIGYMTGGNNSLSDEYKVFSNIMDGKLAAGAKVMPVVLGLEATGSTNIASTQSMLFLKTVEGMVQSKLNEVYSRIFTLALRLFGLDVTAEFKYAPINLRPDDEVEVFKSMKQSRVLEQLSLGFLSDEEASIKLTGKLPAMGAPLLSGTRFFSNTVAGGNPYSNTAEGAQGLTASPPGPTAPKSEKGDR